MIKAIDTHYGGYKFRSRLEARWAIFFDYLGIRWEYEPEGYVLSDGRNYLPDFKTYSLNNSVIWYEIKPIVDADDGKMSVFKKDIKHTGARGRTIYGDPKQVIGKLDKAICDWDLIGKINYDGYLICPRCAEINIGNLSGTCDDLRMFCGYCDETMKEEYRPELVEQEGLFSNYIFHKGDVFINNDLAGYSCKMLLAYEEAMSARFEFQNQSA